MKRAIFALWVLLTFASATSATTVLKMDLAALTEKSPLIITGTVLDVESRYEQTGPKVISTYVTVKVDQVLKGRAAGTVTIQVPGGAVAGQTLKVFGAPAFEKSERVFLLLEKSKKDENLYWVSGLFQGRYLIFLSGGTDYAVMDQGRGRKILADCSQDIPACLEGQGMAPMTLNDLTDRVKGLIKNPPQETP